MLAVGVDIGGTKCAVSLGRIEHDNVQILYKGPIRVTCEYSANDMLRLLAEDIAECMKHVLEGEKVSAVGISCGGPLDSKNGTILSPPNLPGWDNIKVIEYFKERTGQPVFLCNDANACALAEWKFGAGKGVSSMVFMTFGTGLGAGLILDNRLYTGASDMAGELGHIRVSGYGPVGYGKIGSFEGFCSGGGIAQLAQTVLLKELQCGKKPALCPDIECLKSVTAKEVGIAAKSGDSLALKILELVGTRLGYGLAAIMDMLNPERIVIGSIFARCYNEIWPAAEKVITEEALSQTRECCRVVPSLLGDSVGDIAALAAADYYIKERVKNEG